MSTRVTRTARLVVGGSAFASRVQTGCVAHLSGPDIRKNAELNW